MHDQPRRVETAAVEHVDRSVAVHVFRFVGHAIAVRVPAVNAVDAVQAVEPIQAVGPIPAVDTVLPVRAIAAVGAVSAIRAVAARGAIRAGRSGGAVLAVGAVRAGAVERVHFAVAVAILIRVGFAVLIEIPAGETGRSGDARRALPAVAAVLLGEAAIHLVLYALVDLVHRRDPEQAVDQPAGRDILAIEIHVGEEQRREQERARERTAIEPHDRLLRRFRVGSMGETTPPRSCQPWYDTSRLVHSRRAFDGR